MKVKILAAALALTLASNAQAGGFVEDHPWWTTAGGVALLATTQGIPQIFGGIYTLAGLSHGLKPQIKAATAAMNGVHESMNPTRGVDDYPLCNGESFQTEVSAAASNIQAMPKQTRAQNIAAKMREGCETPSADHSGRVGYFSTDWNSDSNILRTTCSYPGGNMPREIVISFTREQAQWRTVGANCAHPVTFQHEAELKARYGENALD